jgi:hypothetical protein
LGAESAFPLYECPKIKISLFENLDYCVFYNLPKQLIDVVIYPIEIGTNQKWYKNLAAFENIIFNFLLFLSIFLVFRVKRFQESVKITVQMCMYFIVVSMFVFALVEGNYGTSYRHKLLILGPILILINLNLPKLKTNWDIH